MKCIFTALILISISIQALCGQEEQAIPEFVLDTNKIETQFVLDYNTKDTLYSFYAFENTAKALLSKIQEVSGKKACKRPVQNFRNLTIEGLGKVTIQTMEGIHYIKGTRKEGDRFIYSASTHTFKNKKAKENCPETLPQNQLGVMQIYFNDNNLINLAYDADVLNSRKKKDIALSYLQSLLE